MRKRTRLRRVLSRLLLFSVQPASVSSTVMSLASLPMASSLGEKSPAPPSAQPLLRYPVLLAEPAERG